jgi:hypothetical protein
MNMTDRRLFLTALLSLAVVALPAAAQLSVVKLKDGKQTEGFVLSNDGKTVKVETVEGKTLTYAMTQVDVVEETKRWGDPAIDAEFSKLDAADADGLADLAETAKAKGLKSWTRLAEASLKIDKNNDKANGLVGAEKIGEIWYRTKKEADEAKKKAYEERMKADGRVKVGSGDKAGWIAKEDKPGYDRDPKKYMKDETGLYRRIEDVMREQGKELVKGDWVRAATAEDKADCAQFKVDFEADCVGLTSTHFRIFSSEHGVKQVESFLDLAEKNYAWFKTQVGMAPEDELFPHGARGQIWLVKDRRAFDKFVNKWGASRFGMSADWINYITQPGRGGGVHSGLGLHAINAVEQLDESGVKSSVVHNSSHMLIDWFVRMPGKGAPEWLTEAWGHYAEEHFTGIGQQTCVTKANYGAGGGISDKKFTTKDAKDHCKGMVLDGSDDVFQSIAKKDLNGLNGDDLAKGYTIVDWMMKTRPKDFVKFMSSMRAGEDEKTIQSEALKAGLGWDYDQLDGEWRKYVKAKF